MPDRSPNCNPHAERWAKSIKYECHSRLVLFGRGPLDKAIAQYVVHYNDERPHQSLQNTLIEPERLHSQAKGRVVRSERLGGLLSYYHRAAA